MTKFIATYTAKVVELELSRIGKILRAFDWCFCDFTEIASFYYERDGMVYLMSGMADTNEFNFDRVYVTKQSRENLENGGQDITTITSNVSAAKAIQAVAIDRIHSMA